MDFSIPATAIPVKEIVLGIYKSSEGALKRKLKSYTTDKKVKKIYDHLRDIGKVRTIWQTERPVPIKNFYYPQRVSCDEMDLVVNNFDDLLRVSKRIVVQGIVGQGKSIFLRNLCTVELKVMKTIPVFIELRKYNKNISIVDHICAFLSEVGFDGSKDTFNHLMEKNKIRLVLDAYDELPVDAEVAALKEIESIARTYPELEIIISSRPDYSIQRSDFFTVVSISPLEENDLIKILNKLCQSKDVANEIYEGICSSTSSISSILTTPLMVTLLIFVYKSDHKIPVRPIEFFDSLFATVLSRHDKLKPGGVNRDKKVLIADSDFLRVFNCFSFLSGQESKTSMKEGEAIAYLEKARGYTKLEFNSEDFISDICKITCLVLKEGFDYNYLHKSIQEYHSAKFISSIPDEKVSEFYSKILASGKWKKWAGQIDFLMELDAYRCNKYFIVPSCKEFSGYIFDKNGNLKSSLVGSIFNKTNLRVRKTRGGYRVTGVNFGSGFPDGMRDSYLYKKCISIIGGTIFKFNQKLEITADVGLAGDSPQVIKLSALLGMLSAKDSFSRQLNSAIKAYVSNMKVNADSVISRLDSADELFSL